MPSSASESIPYLIEFTRKNRPELHKVLDVGVGFGKDGFLLREYYDVKEWHKYQPKDWKLQIIGVDIYDGYLSELQRILYNDIVIGNILDVLPNLGQFELAILADIIEHFTKEEGLKLLHMLFEYCEDILITTPHGFHEHKADEENPHEEHKSGWTMDDFKEFKVIDSVVIKRIRKSEELLVVYLRKN